MSTGTNWPSTFDFRLIAIECSFRESAVAWRSYRSKIICFISKYIFLNNFNSYVCSFIDICVYIWPYGEASVQVVVARVCKLIAYRSAILGETKLSGFDKLSE